MTISLTARPKRAKVTAKSSARVEQMFWYVEYPSEWVLQLPCVAHSPNEKSHWAKHAAERDAFDMAMRCHLRGVDRECVEHITFVRISPGRLDEDNLPPSFKPYLDRVCAYLEHGDAEYNRRGIGHSDGRLAKRGLTWDRRQETHPTAQGIRLHFRMRATAT